MTWWGRFGQPRPGSGRGMQRPSRGGGSILPVGNPYVPTGPPALPYGAYGWPGAYGPAPSPFFPGGCGVPIAAASEAYEFLVIGIANPFALNWIPPLTLVPTSAVDPTLRAAGQIFPLGKTVPLPAAEDVIHPGDGGRTPAGVGMDWHHISIGVKGETIFLTASLPDNPERFAQSGNPSTLLKARITLSMGNSRTRRFDVDVGAGVEIDVRCRAVVDIEPLVPDPRSFPAELPPELVTDPEAFTFAVALVTTVMCGCCTQGYKMPASYSQAFFITGDPVGLMPIVSDARELELFASDVIAGSGSAVGRFVYAYEPSTPGGTRIVPSILPALPPPPIMSFMGQINSPPGEGSTRRVIIPGNANAIIVSRGATTDGSTVNVVQILNV